MYNVYIKMTDTGLISGIESASSGDAPAGWTQIDEDDGDRYMHAQGNYLPKPLTDEQGRYRYKLVDGAIVERTLEELAGDVIPAPTAPTLEERTSALETATQQQAATLDEVVTILEAIV